MPQTTPLLQCTFGSTTVANGNSVSAYQSASVPFGGNWGQKLGLAPMVLSGSFQFSSCSVEAIPPLTASITIPSANQDTVGTATYELTFSEEVTGLSGNNLSAA